VKPAARYLSSYLLFFSMEGNCFGSTFGNASSSALRLLGAPTCPCYASSVIYWLIHSCIPPARPPLQLLSPPTLGTTGLRCAVWVCVNVACSVEALWVVSWTRKALYKYSPFTIYITEGSKVLLYPLSVAHQLEQPIEVVLDYQGIT